MLAMFGWFAIWFVIGYLTGFAVMRLHLAIKWRRFKREIEGYVRKGNQGTMP